MRWLFSVKALKQAIDKYNVGFSELGLASRKRMLSREAFDLQRDYLLMVDAGADEQLVLTRMAAGIQALVRKASSTATPLPETVQPIVQKAIALGLIDAVDGPSVGGSDGKGLVFLKSGRTIVEQLVSSNAFAVLLASSLIALIVFLTTDAIDLGDSNSYLIYSFSLSKFTVNPGVYFRTSGYPLLLTATLYPWTGSLIGILAVQAVFAALIPYYIYKLFELISERLALIAGFVAILTFLPFNYQNVIYPDQTELFAVVAFTYYVARYAVSAKPQHLIPTFASFALLSLLRPTFILSFGLLLAVIAFHAAQRYRSGQRLEGLGLFAALTVGVVALHLSFSAADWISYQRLHKVKPSMDGRQVFFNAYFHSAGVPGAFTDGTYAVTLRQKFEDYFAHPLPEYADVRHLRPSMGDTYYEQRFAPFRTNPKAQVAVLFAQPDVHSYWVLFLISDVAWGKPGDDLFLKVAIEQYLRHPQILWNTMSEGLYSYLWGWNCGTPEWECVFFPNASGKYPGSRGWPQVGPWLGMKSYTEAVVGHRLIASLGTPVGMVFDTFWPKVYELTLRLAASLTALGLLIAIAFCIFRSKLDFIRTEVILLMCVVSVYGLYIVPMCLFGNSLYRYQSAGVLFLVASALLSVRAGALIVGRAARSLAAAGYL